MVQPTAPGYFETLGIPLVQGRLFTEQDDAESLPVAVVNQTLARRFWPGENPVGRKVTFGGAFGPSGYFPEVPREVVGVVADFKSTGLGNETDPEIYFPHQQAVWRSMSTVVRTQGDPLALADELRQEVWTLDRSIAVFQLRTMDEVVSQSVARPRLNTGLLTAFAVISLVLAAIGVYGLISYSVSLRSSEIGLRMALGAQRRDILWQMLREGAVLTAVGLVVGTLVALALTRSLTALLFEIAPTDPLTFASVALLLLAVTLLASYLPARRATRVDPLVALRDQ
jgi:putative ABC transport system permease protein